MIRFNQLSISPDGETLVIDVSVREESYYDEVFLESIIIDNQDTYISNGPSSKPIFEWHATTPEKRVILTLTPQQLGSLRGLFFVYVTVDKEPTDDAPCDGRDITTMGTVTNAYPFYQQALGYMKEMGEDCTIPQDFIDYILKLKGLELSVKTGNYPEAIKYYNKFFKGRERSSGIIKMGGCGCGNK